jgi:hypothetical protein
MEADWAAELGSDLPSIDIPWEGFVDLRHAPSGIRAVEEASKHPALREALLTLNSKASPVFTSKCDVWTLASSEIDPDEFDAPAENPHDGVASYIDLLQIDPGKFASFEFHELWARGLTRHLQGLTLTNGRVEFVIRAASIDLHSGYGLTLYAAGCGADTSSAYAAWQAVLRATVIATMDSVVFPPPTGE